MEVGTLFPARTIDHIIDVDLGADDEFGYSVILDRRNELLIIGAPGADGGVGALYVVRIQGLYHGEYGGHSVHHVGARHLSSLFGENMRDCLQGW